MEPAESSLEVQKSSQQLLILGDKHPLLQSLSNYLKEQDIQPHHSPISQETPYEGAKKIKPGNLLPFLAENEPDYFFILVNQNLLTWLEQKEHSSLLKKTLNKLTPTRKLSFITDPEFLSEFQLPGKTLLINQVYGPQIEDNHLVHKLLTEAITQKTITTPGDGLQTTYPLYIDDAIDQSIKLILNPYLSKEKIHLLSSEPSSYLNLAYKIRSTLSQQTDIKFDQKTKKKDLSSFTPSPDLIDWQPKISLEEGLEKTLSYYKKHPPKKQGLKDQKIPQTTPTKYKKENPTKTKKKTQEKGAQTSFQKQTKSSPILRLKPLKKIQKRKQFSFVKKSEEKRPNFFKKLKRPFSFSSKPSKTPSSKPKTSRVILSAFLIALTLYTFIIVGSGFVVYFGGKRTFSDLKQKGTTSTFNQKITQSSAFFLRANTNALLLFPPLSSSQNLIKTDKLLHAFSLLLKTTPQTQELLAIGKDITNHTLGKEEKNITSLSQKAKSQTTKIYEQLSYLSGLLPEELPKYATKAQNQKYQSLKQDLQTTRTTLLATKNLLSVWPQISGVQEPKKYAILLQNNMELRPTGGFIGSYAIAEFDQGELFNLQIHDVYDADGQLKGHIDPPEPIEEHLGEANWYLRDSNWDPDFPSSARRVEWFFDKTINQEFEGTIGINLYTIQELLDVTGPIKIPDYEQEITSKNLFEKSEYHAEVNFFPGSNQKKEFLSAVSDVLFLRLQDLPEDKLPALARAVYSSLSKNHTLISLKNPTLATTFKSLGWDGSIQNPPCPTLNTKNSCTQTYLFPVDANLGINKSNFFLEKQASLDTVIHKDGEISHSLSLFYKNNSNSNSWPAGDYVNYFRLYLPLSAKLTSVNIGDNPLSADDITLKEKHGKIEVGFLLQVPIKSQKTITINYKDQKLEGETPIYSLYWQKQSGTSSYPLNITLNYPLYLSPTLISPQADLSTQQISFSLSNSQDRRILVQFQSK